MIRTSNPIVLAVLLFVNCCHGQDSSDRSVTGPSVAAAADVLSPDQWDQIDLAVDRGIASLAAKQQRDGSFPTHQFGQPGVTALCLLAFSAQGYLPNEGAYGAELNAAISYILSCQKPNGLICSIGPSGKIVAAQVPHEIGSRASYNHAITSLALSEVYGMTRTAKSKRISAAVSRAIQLSVELQKRSQSNRRDKGGWRYLDREKPPYSDLSVTGWYLMSLRSAKNAGFDVPQEPIENATDYVLRCFDRKDRVFKYGNYRRPERNTSRGMAAAGILALAHAGKHHSTESLASGDWILHHPFPAYNRTDLLKCRYHYSAFYCCQALYQLGGPYWRQGFPQIAHQLVANQNNDGSWPADANSHEGLYGESYSTALAVLALSASNQLLPIFQR